MALSTFTGSFSANISTGNQAVTGVGFTPKAVLFLLNDLTADGSGANMVGSFGMAISSSSRVATAITLSDNILAASPNIYQDNTKCILIINNAGTIIFGADLVSLDADGFTINIGTTDGIARSLTYFALGGSDLTNVFIKEFSSATTTGNQAQTGVGFTPDSTLFLTNLNASAPSFRSGGFFSLGVGNSATARNAFNHNLGVSAPNTQNQRGQVTTKVINMASAGAILFAADLVSLDADGFTINWTTANGTARKIWALCLKGGQFKAGSFNQATSTGNQAITGVGFQTNGIFLRSWSDVASASVTTGDVSIALGFGTSSSSRGGIVWASKDAVITTSTSQNLDRTKIIKMMSPNSSTPTTNAAADLVSLDADGFTVNNTTVDVTAREILYLALGSTGGGGPVFAAGSLTKYSEQEVLNILYGSSEHQYTEQEIANIYAGNAQHSKTFQEVLNDYASNPQHSKTEQETLFANVAVHLGFSGDPHKFSVQELLNMAKNSSLTIQNVIAGTGY